MATRVAIIGCGAVAHAHLAVVADTERAEVTILVDRALERARELAAIAGAEHAVADYAGIEEQADAAIIALPHHLHAPAAKDLLARGVHVLIEKPMALSTRECDEIIAAGEASGAVLAVGQVSRYLAVAQYVKRMLDGGVLGEIESFEVDEGEIYSWPVASDFMFRRETGGGVLADTGAHVLDLLLWWLGDWAEVEYFDDAIGGVEADCELRLRMASGAAGIVRMSRTRDLGNRWVLRGQRGTLDVMRRFESHFRWNIAGLDHDVDGTFTKDGEPEDPVACFHLQFDDFLTAIETGQAPTLSGAEARRAVALMEACRESRRPLERSWEAFLDGSPAHAS